MMTFVEFIIELLKILPEDLRREILQYFFKKMLEEKFQKVPLHEEIFKVFSFFAAHENIFEDITSKENTEEEISEEPQPKYIEEIIKAKKNLIKLGYGGINEDEEWSNWYNTVALDFIDGYGLKDDYINGGCNKYLLYSWIQAAVDGKIEISSEYDNNVIEARRNLIKLGYTDLLIFNNEKQNNKKYKKYVK
ncbi:MAG: hypothetical protein PHI90_08120 [Clostridia bacterium]|nr:hypothetical protein [Clostridia bacterium]